MFGGIQCLGWPNSGTSSLLWVAHCRSERGWAAQQIGKDAESRAGDQTRSREGAESRATGLAEEGDQSGILGGCGLICGMPAKTVGYHCSRRCTNIKEAVLQAYWNRQCSLLQISQCPQVGLEKSSIRSHHLSLENQHWACICNPSKFLVTLCKAGGIDPGPCPFATLQWLITFWIHISVAMLFFPPYLKVTEEGCCALLNSDHVILQRWLHFSSRSNPCVLDRHTAV